MFRAYAAVVFIAACVWMGGWSTHKEYGNSIGALIVHLGLFLTVVLIGLWIITPDADDRKNISTLDDES